MKEPFLSSAMLFLPFLEIRKTKNFVTISKTLINVWHIQSVVIFVNGSEQKKKTDAIQTFFARSGYSTMDT